MEDRISFFNEDIEFILKKKKTYKNWIFALIETQQGYLKEINFVFCSDKYLHQLNVAYLSHDTLTDIITFPYEHFPDVAADIFISIERVKENALDFKLDFEIELVRVMAHGILHLCGYGDKNEQEKAIMRSKENEAIKLFGNF
ncbi:MAG: rRNA maturation RNase YbeY [Saprospiraceae bacterium]|jgi:rRNA maturation RNase YbeY